MTAKDQNKDKEPMLPMAERPVVLAAENISKQFPGVRANDSVNLTLRKGEILALLGENGAGKSTLMNIVYGLYHPDQGKVTLRGHEVRFASPREAIHSGIGMVHQHFQLIPVMSVAENVILGEEGTVSQAARVALEESGFAGNIRLVWGVTWRILTPVVAALIGTFVGFVLFLLTLNIATYQPQGEEFQTSRFQRLELMERGQIALGAYYQQEPTKATLLLWTPLALGTLAGAALMTFGYRHARRTWHGRRAELDYTARTSVFDGMANALLGLIGTMSASLSRARMAERVREISRQFNLEVDPDTLIEKLPVGLQQRVEIVKALYRKADILILDEPTAVLTPQEGQELFRIMRELAAEGVSIIFITHKLKEVFAVADTIVVMRNGRVVGATTPKEATEASLAAMMVGREVMLKVDKKPATPRDVVLSVERLSAKDERGTMAIDNVSFEVRAGEVLGIAGVQGNGQTELVEALTGLRKPLSGQYHVGGEAMRFGSPRAVTLSDTAHVPEDRHRYGMVKPFPVADNLILNSYFKRPFAVFPTLRQMPPAMVLYAAIFGALFIVIDQALWSPAYQALAGSLNLAELNPRQQPGAFLLALAVTMFAVIGIIAVSHWVASTVVGVLWGRLDKASQTVPAGGLTVDQKAVNQHADNLIAQYDIRTPNAQVSGGSLSGGNQQKLVVAREFSRRPRLLIASQPTRGIDVGSIEFIHNQIVAQRDEGAAVLLVSAELDEIMALSDRIAVMYKGHIVGVVPAESATREQLGLLMAGIVPEGKA